MRTQAIEKHIDASPKANDQRPARRPEIRSSGGHCGLPDSHTLIIGDCTGIRCALFSGLIAGIISGVIVAPLSGSSLGISGPTAGLAVIVLNAIQQLGFNGFLLALVVAGIIQIIMGLARQGLLLLLPVFCH